MGATALLAIGLIFVGVALGAGGLLLVGVLMGLVVVLQSIWSRYGLRALDYERHISAPRVPWGERIDLDLVVRNAKPLPLPWLQIEDLVSHGAEVVGRPLIPSVRRGFDILRGTWRVGWFERVTRRFQIVGSRRGTYRFVEANLRVADLFARSSRREARELSTVYHVVPRVVGVRSTVTDSPSVGASPSVRGLHEEPSLFAGVRPYQPGDPLRRIHWKATARVGRPVSRRYDPAREREALIAVDMQTLSGPSWMLSWDDDLAEGLCVAALSLVRSYVVDGIAAGIAVNAYSERPQRTVFLAPSANQRQVGAIADLLADVSPFASLPFDRLLANLARRVPTGCSIIALSGRDPEDFLATLRRLGADGYVVSHAGFGPEAARWTARARAFGLRSAAYRLEPDWQTADALERIA